MNAVDLSAIRTTFEARLGTRRRWSGTVEPGTVTVARLSSLRRFGACLAVGALGVVATLSPVDAQQPARTARIGYLAPVPQPPREEHFRQELRRLGYVEGKTVAIEYRSADGRLERLPELAAELVRLDVDVLVAVVTQAALAAKAATKTIPIVMVGVGDPLGSGLVASLARPGGNITGTSVAATDVVGKQLGLLREALPKVSSVAVLWNPANAVFQKQQLDETRAAAAKLKLGLRFFEARTPEELDGAFAAIARQRAEALFILADPMLAANLARIADFAVKHRLPTLGGSRFAAEAGALVAYGPDYVEAYRRAATFVDRILKGSAPGELPVELSTKFELVLNAKTARAIGVAFPEAVVLRADHVVQ